MSIFLSNLGIGAIELFDRFWLDLVQNGMLPLKCEFYPERIRDVLPNLMVKDVLRCPLDFRFRLMGTAICYEFGTDYTGQRFTQIDNYGPDSLVWQNNKQVLDTGGVSRNDIPYRGRTQSIRSIKQASYPFSNNGEDVDYVFTVIEFHSTKATASAETTSFAIFDPADR
mgnify:CR=1 FL=1